MSDVLDNLKRAILAKAKLELLNKEGNIVEDITQAVFLKIHNGDSSEEQLSLDETTKFGNNVLLRVIYHCWLNKDSSAADYLKDCENKHLPNISFLQRTDLYNWLSGTSSTSKYIKDSTSNKEGETTTLVKGALSTETIIDTKSEAILNNERILSDHNSALRGLKPVNFQYLIKEVDQTLIRQLKEELKNKNHVNKKKPSASATHSASSLSAGSSFVTKEPIIMIPSAASSLFTIANIKQFLVDGVYISPKDLPPPTQDMIRIEKKLDNIEKPLRFIIVNNTRLFSKQEYWARVIGVFVSGHDWQFSHYKWSNPNELFQHCNGYYFNFEGDAIPKNVANWNVKNISLDKTKRFRDLETSRFFWNSVQKELYSKGYR